MIDADKVMNPQHLGSDPAKIRINPEIWRPASVPITLLMYNGSLLCGFNTPV